MLHIAYDRDDSTETEPKYFVFDDIDHVVLYKGTYTQCLCICGAFHIDPTMTIEEIRNKSNGFI